MLLSHNFTLYVLCLIKTPNKQIRSPAQISEALKQWNPAFLVNLKSYQKEYSEQEACDGA